MKQQWQRLLARYDALAQRERLMIAGALIFAILWLGYSLLVEPQLLRQSRAVKALAVANAELPQVDSAVAQAQQLLKDPDAATRASLQQTRQAMAGMDGKLRELSASMVPSEKMPLFLESLLVRNPKLELLSLRTLPPGLLIERKEDKSDAAAGSAGALPNIYKHGVELRIAGSYSDLLAYLEDLERTPQRILWNKLTLSVEQYPRSVLTLTVYTLSLDKQWLVV